MSAIKPKVLFVCIENSCRSQMAEAFGKALGKGLPSICWDYVITMGCGDSCPTISARMRQDWQIPDPKNLPLNEFRKVRDEIKNKVQELIAEISKEER